MPGLRLRVEQAQRLWNLDRTSCEVLLRSLVDAKFLTAAPTRPTGGPDTLGVRLGIGRLKGAVIWQSTHLRIFHCKLF